MPGYTPPTGNAVNFDFTVAYGLPPPGRSILFNFGAIPGPPFVDIQLPTGLRQHFFDEPDWTLPYVRKFAPVVDPPTGVRMKALFRFEDYEYDYIGPTNRRILVVPPFSVGIRPVLFTVT